MFLPIFYLIFRYLLTKFWIKFTLYHLSVVLYDLALDKWLPGAHAGTFRGNQLAMAAGLATLRYIQENRLADCAAAMGDRLMSHLRQIQAESRCIGDVRGRGLMIGVEIVNLEAQPNRCGSYPAYSLLASRIQSECLRRGLILEIGGRFGSVIRLWEEPVEVFLSSPGLLPYAVLSQATEKEIVLGLVVQELEQITDPREQSNLIAATSILAGLELEQQTIQQLIRSPVMRESTMYQFILREGRAEGLEQGLIQGRTVGESISSQITYSEVG